MDTRLGEAGWAERLPAGYLDSHYELHDLGNDVSCETEKYKEI